MTHDKHAVKAKGIYIVTNYKYYPSKHRKKMGKDRTLHEKELTRT